MTRKDKLLLSNITFLLTAIIAFSMLLVKTSDHTQIATYVSTIEWFTLISPMMTIVIIAGLLNITLGTMIICSPLFIELKQTEFSFKENIQKIQSDYVNHNHKKLCVFRC